MKKIGGIFTRSSEKIIECEISSNLGAKIGDSLIVETDLGIEFGRLRYITGQKISKSFGKIVRVAKKLDSEVVKKEKVEEAKIFESTLIKIKKHGLPMKLIAVRLSFDRRNLIFYFTAETRVDFRSLLKDLVATYHKLIRLQQIGPRDEAKFLGKVGICGRNLCCRSFLHEINSITMDLARDQNLEGVTSSKISGVCGKLMCCLNYELYLYKMLAKNLPKIGDEIRTKKGKGRVINLNVIAGKVLVELPNGEKEEIFIPIQSKKS